MRADALRADCMTAAGGRSIRWCEYGDSEGIGVLRVALTVSVTRAPNGERDCPQTGVVGSITAAENSGQFRPVNGRWIHGDMPSESTRTNCVVGWPSLTPKSPFFCG